MNTPIDALTLALVARRAPETLLYAQMRSKADDNVYIQHAVCCVRERGRVTVNNSLMYEYYHARPHGPASLSERERICPECGAKYDSTPEETAWLPPSTT